MIFEHTLDYLLEPSPHTGKLKTQTRRRAKIMDNPVYNGDTLISVISSVSQRVKYALMQERHVRNEYGKRGVWWKKNGNSIEYSHRVFNVIPPNHILMDNGWFPLKIKVLRLMPAHNPSEVSEEDLLCEGYATLGTLLKVTGTKPVWGIEFRVIMPESET